MTDYLQLAAAAAARGRNLMANAYRRVAADPPVPRPLRKHVPRPIAGPPPLPKATPLMSHRHEPVRKDEDPLDSIHQRLAAVRTPRGTDAPAPASPPLGELLSRTSEEKVAAARGHLAKIAEASARRVGNQAADSGPTAPPRGGGSLRAVIDRASENVPFSGGVRWPD